MATTHVYYHGVDCGCQTFNPFNPIKWTIIWGIVGWLGVIAALDAPAPAPVKTASNVVVATGSFVKTVAEGL